MHLESLDQFQRDVRASIYGNTIYLLLNYGMSGNLAKFGILGTPCTGKRKDSPSGE